MASSISLIISPSTSSSLSDASSSNDLLQLYHEKGKKDE